MAKYTIGVDFGTLSGRILLLDLDTGKEVDVVVHPYSHGVIWESLGGKKLPRDYALQHPQDYLEVFYYGIKELFSKNKIDKEDIVALGIDFTACTIMPVYQDGTPLCMTEKYKNQPHAYPKLWKHHSAQKYADRLNKLAVETNQPWIKTYGNKISGEWAIPKLMEIAEECPDIYQEMDRFIEAGDWVVWQLIGMEKRSKSFAGYKAILDDDHGYPSEEFMEMLHPLLKDCYGKKFSDRLYSPGEIVGNISEGASIKTGLSSSTKVVTANIDAHVCIPALGICEPGKMLAIIGTSTCHILLGDGRKDVPGICGVVYNGSIDGYFAYETGQACVGDGLQWFVDNMTPSKYFKKAKKKGKTVHDILTKKSMKIPPGESGIICLDWFNGNRSILVDTDLSGLFMGINLNTKPEHLYRSIIEATGFGTRIIIENYREHGIEVKEYLASGGIANKNPHMMQMYADILNMPIRISETSNGPALGSAIMAAIGISNKEDLEKTIKKYGRISDKVYYPNPEHVKKYDELYKIYKELHDRFGVQERLMKTLRSIGER